MRPSGPPSTSEEYEQRDPPKPLVRRLRAAIETAADFGRRRLAEAGCLMLGGATELTFLSNGYEWSWIVATDRLPDADPIPDVHTTPIT